MKHFKSLLLVSFLMLACKGNQNTGTNSNEELASSVEDAVTTIGALMDDQEGEGYATNSQKTYPEIIEELFLPRAYADNCVRPVFKVCDNGTKSSVFQDCSLFRGNVLASGEIHLAYSQNDCSMSNAGDQVGRTYDFELVGPRGGQLQVSSSDHTDYAGDVVGGGAQVTRTTSGWDLEILGKHKVFTRNGKVRMDKSIKTLSPLEVTGGLRRSQRRVSNGQIQVAHNLAEFKATYTAQDLQWSSSCCHPVSGSLSVEYTGSKSGTATVEFNTCGEATLDRGGEIENVQFSYCE